MIEINWNPTFYIGAIPIHWYGITWALGFFIGGYLTWRWAPKFDVPRERITDLIIWILAGSLIGSRLYFIVQNDPSLYLNEPWRIPAIWEGGMAYFGGLFGGTLGAYIYAKRETLDFLRLADLFAPAILIGSAIGRISCGLAGMDYGTPTALPWGVVYTNANSDAPLDGVARHPAQFYELIGDLIIAGILIRIRRLPRGSLFCIYLLLFGILRFLVFFVRGNVPPVALGLANAQWTALAILLVAIPALFSITLRQSRSKVGAAI